MAHPAGGLSGVTARPPRIELWNVLLSSAAIIALPASGQTSNDRADDANWALIGPSFSYHQQRSHANRPYNEKNFGLGLAWQRKIDGSAWEQSREVYVARDSFNQTSLFIDTTLSRAIAASGNLSFHTGGKAGIAYKNADWDGPRTWRPYVAAVICFRQERGINAKISYAYHKNSSTNRVNGVFVLQFAHAL